MKAALPSFSRPSLEPHLPTDLAIAWYANAAEAASGIADADLAWLDMQPKDGIVDAIAAAGPGLRWVSTMTAGLDGWPLAALRDRGIVLTNGSGMNAETVAEYAVMGVLVAAKRFDQVVRAFDRREWLTRAPGWIQLAGSAALVIGYGTIGRRIGAGLEGLGVTVTGVTRSGRDGTLGAEGWRDRLGTFDWVVLAAPSTDGTRAMIGAAELAAMRDTAWLVNIARGDLIDDDALVAALAGGGIGGAFLDPTHPEPLPPAHPLWTAPNCMISMHLSGRSQTDMVSRAATLFLDNLAAFRSGRAMRNVADVAAGY